MKNLLSKIKTFAEDNPHFIFSFFAFILAISALVLCFSLPSSAADEPSYGGQLAAPTDLTGTSWYVPSGFRSTAGLGIFNVNGSFIPSWENAVETEFSKLKVGYTSNKSQANSLAFYNPATNVNIGLSNSYSVTVTFIGGLDVINSDLISWLMANATWTNPPEPEPEPDPEFEFYLPSGIYEFHRFTPPSLDEGEVYDYKGTFYFENTSYAGMRISCIYNTVNVYMLPKTSNTYQLVGSYNDPSNVIVGKRVYLPFGVYADSEEGLTVLNETLKPSPEDNPLMAVGFMISGVFSALDEFILFSGFSLLDFIYTCIGLLASVWFLKLLAGG